MVATRRLALFCGCLRRFAGIIRASCRWKTIWDTCDPASLVLYGRCQASSRPHARSKRGESLRTL